MKSFNYQGLDPLILKLPISDPGRWMAFSPPAMTIPKRILYGIAVCIAVVGGENSSTSLTTTLHPTALGR